MQKSLPCANAQATLYGWTQTHIIDDSGDRANVQQGVCQNTGGRKLSSAFCNSILLHIGLDIIYLAFCCYFHHQFLNHHRYRADGILIPVLRQALSVTCHYRPTMLTSNFRNKELIIQDCWTVEQNNFIDLEPDNNFDIDLVAENFVEDILQATLNGYIIDLGFYGSYYENRNGFFKLLVIKGDFLQGELFETFISRSTDDIAAKLNKYFDIISTHQLDNIKGYIYGQSTKNIDDFDIYSAIDNVKRHLTDNEIKEIYKSTVREK